MAKYSREFIRDVTSIGAITNIETKFKLRKGFFARLLKQDDWSFIIKLHALIEAACTDLILHRIDEPGLKTIVSRLELSNKTYGKLAIIKELDLLNEDYRRFVSSLSEWRNNFVHNVENCNASLSKIVAKMDQQQLKKFAFDFSPQENFINRISRKGPKTLFDENTVKRAKPEAMIARAKTNPKHHIWLGALHLIGDLIDTYSYNEYLQYDKAMKITGLYNDDDNEVES